MARLFPLFLILSTLLPLAGTAQEADGAVAVVNRFYKALGEGDCDTALRLRPEYSLERCQSITVVHNHTASYMRSHEQYAVVHLFVRFNTAHDAETKTFSGFLLLENRGNDWIIISDSFKSANADYNIDKFLSDKLPSYTGLADATPRVTDDVDVTGAPETSATITDDEAVRVFLRHYDALGSGDCAVVLATRSSTTVARCEDTSEVLQYEVSVRENLGHAVVLEAKIALRRREKGDADHLVDFRGFLTVRVDSMGLAIIDGNSFSSTTEGLSLDDYLWEQGLRKRSAVDHAVHRTLAALPGAEASLAAQNLPPTDAGSFGSRAVLESCWTHDRLRGRPSEKKTRKTGPGAYMKSPARLRPERMLPPVVGGLRNSIRRVDTGGRKVVALTFDIGERNNDVAGYDGAIVDYLREEGVKATFYFGGKYMATHPERSLQLIADPQFEAGNHAWTHGNLRVLKGRAAEDQVLYTQAQYELLLEELWSRRCARDAGAAAFALIPQTLLTFRYPYGTCSAETLDAVNDMGLLAVQWEVVTSDPIRRQSPQAIAKRVLKETRPGSIVIMHANGRGYSTSRAMPIFVPELRARGYEFVTISELMSMGTPVATRECYERRPGDNRHYDRLYGRGTGD